MHVRPAILELGERIGDPHLGQGDQVIGDADIEFAPKVAMQGIHLVAKTLQVRDQPARGLVHGFSFGGEHETGAPALAQREPEPGLQFAHMDGDGRPADPEAGRSRREARGVDHGAEYPQQTQVDIADLAQPFDAAIHVDLRFMR